MSSILTALKRLEAETEPAAGRTLPDWLSQPEAAPGRPVRIQAFFNGTGRWWLVAAMVLAAAAALAAVWIAQPVPEPLQTGVQSMAASPVRTAPAEAPDRPPIQLPAHLTPAPRPGPPASGASPPVMPWAHTASPPVQATRKAAPAGPAAPVSPPAFAPPPAASGLTLQAISWAPRAESRIAVVSGQILRVGDEIDGYRVKAIEPDAVTVCRGQACFGLAFDVSR